MTTTRETIQNNSFLTEDSQSFIIGTAIWTTIYTFYILLI